MKKKLVFEGGVVKSILEVNEPVFLLRDPRMVLPNSSGLTPKLGIHYKRGTKINDNDSI